MLYCFKKTIFNFKIFTYLYFDLALISVMSAWVLLCKFLLLYPYYHIAKKYFFQKFVRVLVCITDGNTKINEDPEWNFGATAIVSNGQYGCNTKYGCFRFSHPNAIVWYSRR